MGRDWNQHCNSKWPNPNDFFFHLLAASVGFLFTEHREQFQQLVIIFGVPDTTFMCVVCVMCECKGGCGAWMVVSVKVGMEPGWL